MYTLFLRLAGPMQSWGDSSKFEVRKTYREPTKSGVAGLVAAALGRGRQEPIDDIASLTFGVRVDQEGRLERDFHMVTAGKTSYVTHRYYLMDASFVAGLSSEDRLFLEEIREALLHPVFPLALGRRSCPVTLPLVLGLMEGDFRDVVGTISWQGKARNGKMPPSLRVMVDAGEDSPTKELRQDVPVSFDPRKREHGYRYVEEYYIKTPGYTQLMEHDPMGEL